MKTNKSISQAWMAYHPYTKETSIDHYYIGLCIRVRDILRESKRNPRSELQNRQCPVVKQKHSPLFILRKNPVRIYQSGIGSRE
jgi:hypothetical protein